MNRRWFGSDRKRSPGGLAASVAIHVAIVLLLAQMVFRYPISILVGLVRPEPIKTETLHFVRVRPPPPSSVQPPARKPVGAPRAAQPAPLVAPSA
ncbi:MAG: hypothetical protein KGL38_06070, partial [Gemmatimonadota bacterium]|nr:hypothetical protein [Gemmatimonadota bacterium]